MSDLVKVQYKFEARNRRRLIVLGRDVAFWEPDVSPFYGVDETTIGPSNEPAATTGTEATTADYQTVIPAASPGDTILLRAGTYTGDVTIPAGTTSNWVTVKPYNQETVIITGRPTFSNYTILAGVEVDRGVSSGQTLSLNSSSSTSLHDIEVRYCNLLRGQTETVRLSRNVTDVRFHHNYMDGGTNHVWKSHWQSSAWAPTNIEIDHSVVTKDLWGGIEDGIQLEGWGYHNVHHNTFRNIPTEDGMDIKPPYVGTGVVVDVHHNYFDGDTIAQGSLLCQSGADADARIYDNHFAGDGVITLGATQADAYIDFQWNIVDGLGYNTRITFWNLTDSVFRHNHVETGTLRMGSNARLVKNLLVADNCFYETNLNAEAATTVHADSTDNGFNSLPDESEWTALGISAGVSSCASL